MIEVFTASNGIEIREPPYTLLSTPSMPKRSPLLRCKRGRKTYLTNTARDFRENLYRKETLETFSVKT